MAFIRNKEDFVCEQCGTGVTGNGYTNHCPKCLWSRHVDTQPGDRAATCQGMMEPVAVMPAGDRYRITHRCMACGYEKVNDSVADDRFEALLDIVRRNRDQIMKG